MNWEHPERDKLVLLLGDIALIVLVVLSLFYAQGSNGTASRVPALAMFVLAFAANLYVFELYDLTAQNGAKTVIRLALAYLTSILFLSLWFLLFPRFSGQRNAFMLAGPVLVVSIYAWRCAYAHTVHLFTTSEPVLVIGSQSDAETVSRVTNFNKSKYELVGFLLKEEVVTPGGNGGMASAGGDGEASGVVCGRVRGAVTGGEERIHCSGPGVGADATAVSRGARISIARVLHEAYRRAAPGNAERRLAFLRRRI